MQPEIHIGVLGIPTYFLVVAIAASLGGFWFLKRANARELNPTVALDLVLISLVTGFLGARLFHVFYEEPTYYAENYLRVLYIWNGGFVFLGGLLTAFLVNLFYCQWRREPFWLWADLAALPLGLSYAVGRIACFLNGCCYGRECHFPWGVTLDGIERHPTPLYATAWESVLLLVLLRFEPRWRMPGVTFHVWIIGHSIGRILMEAFRDDPRGPALGGLSVATWICLGLASLATTHLVMAIQEARQSRNS